MNAGQDDDGSKNMAGQDDMSIGERLSAARKEHMLTVESVAEELKLDVSVIEAMERDDKSALPSAIFVQGYLRLYARLVELPEDQLVRDYADSSGEPPPLTVVAMKQKRSSVLLPSARSVRNIILLLLAVIMLWLAYPFVERFVASRGQLTEGSVPGRLNLPPANQLQLPQETER